MAQWYVKDLSELTHISVQTLHHYDRIDLLKPSLRLANGYRLYSEKDLLKLQQIIALKFFGFELAQIKKILAEEVNVVSHFSAQLDSINRKILSLDKTSKALEEIIANYSQNKSIHWETIIQLIEVYRMTQQLENTWAGKVLTSDELKEYARFEKDIKSRLSENERMKFGESWENILKEINANLNKDPSSEYGIDVGNRCMNIVNNFYGKKNAHIRNIVWEKGFKTGAVGVGKTMSSECIQWLDKAIDAYYRQRIYNILNQVDQDTNKILLAQWKELVADMCGDNKSIKDELYAAIMNDEEISDMAKEWVKNNF